MTDRQEDAGSGALFKNDKKEKPSHPDYQGDCTIRGRKFWMSAWIKEGAWLSPTTRSYSRWTAAVL